MLLKPLLPRNHLFGTCWYLLMVFVNVKLKDGKVSYFTTLLRIGLLSSICFKICLTTSDIYYTFDKLTYQLIHFKFVNKIVF